MHGLTERNDVQRAGPPPDVPVGDAHTRPIRTGLVFDPSTNLYQYNWKTEATWTNCREFQIALRDGSTRSRFFLLR